MIRLLAPVLLAVCAACASSSGVIPIDAGTCPAPPTGKFDCTVPNACDKQSEFCLAGGNTEPFCMSTAGTCPTCASLVALATRDHLCRHIEGAVPVCRGDETKGITIECPQPAPH